MKSLWSRSQASPTLFVVVSQLLHSKYTNHRLLRKEWGEMGLELQPAACKSHMHTSVRQRGCKGRDAVGPVPKSLPQGALLISPHPCPDSYRETSLSCSKQSLERGSSGPSGSYAATFIKLRGGKEGRHVNICRGLLPACRKQKQKYLRRNSWEAFFSPRIMSALAPMTALGNQSFPGALLHSVYSL